MSLIREKHLRAAFTCLLAQTLHAFGLLYLDRKSSKAEVRYYYGGDDYYNIFRCVSINVLQELQERRTFLDALRRVMRLSYLRS